MTEEEEGERRGFGFAQFKNQKACKESLRLCRNFRIYGCTIYAEQQKPRRTVQGPQSENNYLDLLNMLW